MASGGRPPHSAPSLPLHTSTSTTADSLQTPDTSTLFMSSLGSSQGSSRSTDFTSLEDLLNFSGISHQLPLSSSLPTSLQSLAQDVEQKQPMTTAAPITIGPPDSKRPCLETTPVAGRLTPSTSSPLTTAHLSQLTTPSSPLSLNNSSLTMANSWKSSGVLPSLASAQVIPQSTSTQLSGSGGPSSAAQPASSLSAKLPLTPAGLQCTSSTASSAASLNFSFPVKTSRATAAQSPVTLVPSVLAQSNHILSTTIATTHCIPSSASTTSAISSLSSPVSQFSTTALFNSTPSTTTLPPSSLPPSSPSSLRINSSPPVTAHSSSLSAPTPTVSLASPSSVVTSLTSIAGLSTANPAQRALLVQLVQAYRQCTALGDTQGQARVKAQLNLLLNAQQKMGGAFIVPPPSSTLSPAITAVNHKTSTSLSPKPKALVAPSPTSPVTPSTTSPHTPSHTSPAAPSLLSNSSKGVDVVASKASLSLGANSVTVGTLPVSSSSIPDHTLSTLTPISRAPPSSGPASALKAAALYNLRLRQLQLYLQSLPEEQRPHSIPELKALLQRGGGSLGSMAQPTVSSTTSLISPTSTTTITAASSLPLTADLPSSTQARPTVTPVPTLLASTLPLRQPAQPAGNSAVQNTTQPTIGQVLPHLTRGLSTAQLSPVAVSHTVTTSSSTAAAAALSHSLSGLATGSLPLSPTVLARFTAGQLVPSSTRPLLSTSSGSVLVTTQLPPATTGNTSQTTPPQLTTVLPSLDSSKLPPTATSVAPTTSSVAPTTSSAGDPIKPGVPTPLPPGVNPETLAVLCRMPDSDLQKLNLPVVLMTAIRVWRGQHSSGHQRRGSPSLSSTPPTSLPQVSTSSSFSLAGSGPATQTKKSAPPPPPSLPTASRPLTRHQVRAEQTKAERDRAATLSKVLQSSEEARIAYRFNMLRDKMTNQLMAPDSHTPFKSLHDVIARLLPYHMWSEAEPPPGAIEKADAVFESVAHVLMSRSQGLMSNYQHVIYHDAQRESEAVMRVYLERLFQESEREYREQESQERQQAAQIATDLSLIAGALRDDDSAFTFDAEFALGDVMNSDPMLTFEPGIT